MEKNASLHRDTGGTSLCAAIVGETGDFKAVGGKKGATDTCKKSSEQSESLHTLVSCNRASNVIPTAADAAFSSVEKLDMPETIESLPETSTQSSGWSETPSPESGDELSNGVGHGLVPLAPGNSEAATSKLVNSEADKESCQTRAPGARRDSSVGFDVPDCARVEPMKLAKPTHLCPDKSQNTGNAKSGVSGGDRTTIAEVLPSGSDPSIAGESRSILSLESFSNPNSCPSSDLNSDGLEDRGLEDRGLEDRGLEDRGLEDRGLEDRGLEDRGLGDRGLEDRGLEDRGLEDRGLEDRGLEDRGLEDRGLEDRGLEDRGLEDRGLEDRGLALALQGEYGAADATKNPCAAKDRGAGQSIYHIKWIRWREENTPIITQNENGPCPLLAIMNVLLLAWKVKMPPMMEIITAEQLMEYLGDYILDAKPKEISEAQRLNYEQNMSDAMAVLHKLQTGLDVNVRFTGVRVFEYTPECIVFDLLDIPLYHGWLVDPQMGDTVKAVSNCSYNQLVEKIISCKQSESSELAGEGFVAEQFLHSTATQLTYHGLCELTAAVQEGELCVFFRNNHFSTMIKYKGQLYLLVTDQGFLTEEKVVWESLHNVDGDGNFCDPDFRLRPPSNPETVYRGQQDQIDQDYLMALSLQQEQQSAELQWDQAPEGLSDLELAKKLQEEEDRRASQYYQDQEQEQEQEQAAAQGQQQPAGGDEVDRGAAAPAGAPAYGGAEPTGATPSPGKQPSSAGERKPKKEPKDKDKCVIL